MATLLHSESRRLYSWWWDSHNSPKNSKWLQENLTDMDAKVKAMIKLIEEDADSFARRAEMYYKKRPELMKLVEEFYRAYRALAERYNHATGELRQAHRTMAQAFPDQVPFVLADDAASSCEPDTPEAPHPLHSFFDPDVPGQSTTSSKGPLIGRKGLKQLNDMFQSTEVRAEELSSSDDRTKGGKKLYEEGSQLSTENQKLKSQILDESERASKAETELQTLKQALAKLEAERDALLQQYQQALDLLFNLEKDLSHAQKDSRNLDTLACEARTEIQAIQESRLEMEAERKTSLLQYGQCLERLAAVESLLSEAQEDSKELSVRVATAELESEYVKKELAKLKAEKESSELLHKQSLEKIAALEKKLALAEHSLTLLTLQSEKTESEIKTLEEEIQKANEAKDVVAVRYEKSLETISELHSKLSEAQADNSRLKSEILLGSAKLKGAEDHCVLLGKLNKSLQLEAETLGRKIAAADEELSQKQAELEKLMVSLQDEHSRFVQVEANLHTLQDVHSHSQDEQRVLAMELKNGLQMMKDLEMCKSGLEVDILRLKDENDTLNNINSSSSFFQRNLQEEMTRLKEIKERLEAEVRRQAEQSDTLQVQVQNLKEEIEGSYMRYQSLVKRLESVGLDPQCLDSSVKGLQDENLRLKELSEKDRANREGLIKRLQDMEEILRKNINLEKSLLEVTAELEISKAKVSGLQESCHGLNEDKYSLVTERTALLSQLQIVTETMQSLLEKNTSLQTSLCAASAELEGLREKSKGLEDFCKLLTSERSNLLAERSSLVSRLETVEQKLEGLESRFANLEDKYSGLEKEKQSTLSQVEELRISLDVEKKERACLVLTTEGRLSGMEGRIQDLQEENKYRKKEFEEQLEKSVNAQVEIFILQKFVQDMEDKNYSLLIECQRHIEAAKDSENLITELESENMIQQVEAEFLLDKIDTLRAGIYQVLKALKIKLCSESEPEQNFVLCVLAKIRDIQLSLSESKDENQQLLVEKSVLSTLLGQLHFDFAELSSRQTAIEQESVVLAQQLLMAEYEKHQLEERSRLLNVDINDREKREEALRAEVENLYVKQTEQQGAYVTLQEENLKASQKNRSLQEELLHIKEEKALLEEETSEILAEAFTLSVQSVILKSYTVDKALELDEILDYKNSLVKAYRELENEAIRLEDKLLVKDLENLVMKASMEKSEEKQLELIACNHELRLQISGEKELTRQKERELSEVEMKLKSKEDVNRELCSTIQCLENDHKDLEVQRIVLEEQIVELSGHNKSQEKELVHFREANDNLQSEVGKLHEEIEECKIREVILASELHQRSSEFELWEAEAASFYFDLQISSIREVLFENKVHDLGSLCEGLEEVTSRRSVEIERMRGRVTDLECEAEALKSQLTTCLPLIASLKDNVALIEKNPLLQSKLHAVATTDQQDNSDLTEESLTSLDGLSELQILQARIKVVEDILEKEKVMASMQERVNADVRLEAALNEIQDLKSSINMTKQEEHRYSVRESVSETSEAKAGAEMKDIPLDQASGRSFHGHSQRGSAASDDQMLELWEAAEQDCSNDQLISEVQEQGTDTVEDEIVYVRSGVVDQTSYNPTPESHFEKELGVDKLEVPTEASQSHRKGSNKNVSDRLASDAQKLMTLQVAVQELKRKMEPNKRTKAEDAEYDALRQQLQGVENSLVQLMERNTELLWTIEESSVNLDPRAEGSSDEAVNIWQRKASVQARTETEKIGRLELEMQKMQYALLRLKDKKNSRSRDGVSRSSASLLLRDFFYSRGRKSKKNKKNRFCGCLRPALVKC